jgi:hypothetical protein
MDESGLRKVSDPDFGKRLVSREPDALIDEKLFGHKVHWMLCGNREVPYRTGWHDCGMPFSVPYYHSDIKDAWLIVEEFGKRGALLNVMLKPQSGDKYWVEMYPGTSGFERPWLVSGSAAELAICKMALKALKLLE